MFFLRYNGTGENGPMKAKKALKQLTKVEELLSNVVDRYAASDHVVQNYLGTAIASVASAKETLNPAAANGSAKKKPVKTARKGTAASKRKATGSVAARQLTQTA